MRLNVDIGTLSLSLSQKKKRKKKERKKDRKKKLKQLKHRRGGRKCQTGKARGGWVWKARRD